MRICFNNMEKHADILEREKSKMYGYLPWYYYFVTIIINIIIIYLNILDIDVFSPVENVFSSKILFIIIIIYIITPKNKNKRKVIL